MSLDAGIDSISPLSAQAYLTSFTGDVDLTSPSALSVKGFGAATGSLAVMSGMSDRPPREWMVTSAGSGALKYDDHFGNTITLPDCANLVGVRWPAGKKIYNTGTSIAAILVFW